MLLRIQSSRFITIRGLTLIGGRRAAVVLKSEQKRQNEAIHLERNRLLTSQVGKCVGGIIVGQGNLNTLIAHNLIYGNGREGITFTKPQGGPHYVLHNTIHDNGRSGIRVNAKVRVVVVNNIISHNGTDPRPHKKGSFGVRWWKTPRGAPETIEMVNNLVCGNAAGEIGQGLLDGGDRGNLTPRGTEGPGVSASPGCEQVATLFANVNGRDGLPATLDDDFTLAGASPALDGGADPRTLGLSGASETVVADFTGERKRPRGQGFDIGALEHEGRCEVGSTEACYTGPVSTQGVGRCQAGTRACSAEGVFGECQGQVLPQGEVCNGADDDCDGQTDEGLGQSSCGVGACRRTVNRCAGGSPQVCTPGPAVAEICNNQRDDDCDGQTDEVDACPVNHPPSITSVPVVTAAEAQVYSYDVEASDPDAGDTLTFSLTVAPFGMSINPATGVMQWTPVVEQAGEQAVTVQVRDTGGLFSRQSFTVGVAEANREPTAVDDRYEAEVGQTLTVPVRGILTNDTDPNQHDTLTATLVSGPTNGTLNLNTDGSFTYTPVVPPPTVAGLDPVLKWKWTGSTVAPTFAQVIVTPIVANLTDDNSDGRIDQHDIPDIVFTSTDNIGSNPCSDGILRAISGADGSVVFDVTALTLRTAACAAVAVGDLDGDHIPEIVAVQAGQNRLVILNHDGTLKNFSESPPAGRLGSIFLAAPSIADLNHDGAPEIIAGATVFDKNGHILFSNADGGQTGFGSLSTAADLDLDGNLEIVSGFQAYRADGSVFYTNRAAGGYPAIGNFDDDPFPEIVVVSAGNVFLLEHDGTLKWGPVAIPGGGTGGPPTVADFDGDGQPEIGVAGAARYAVFETDGTLKWQATTQDFSSQITGSSVFDFDDDGNAEVVYNDELKLRIFEGKTGAVLFETLNPTGTITENPVIADVDNDGHADIVVVRNDIGGFATVSGLADKQGIFVFTGRANNWVRTRRIWNQHAYHITNVTEDARIPAHERPNWLTSGLNNFRTNAFAPGDDQADKFVYKATDGSLDSNEATVFITVHPPNNPPEITSTPLTTATVGLPYRHAVRAIDPDLGDELIFALIAAPAGMTIDPATGLLQWTPASGQLGGNSVTVRVHDRGGLSDFQLFTVQVSAPVIVPNVVGQAQATAGSTIGTAGLVVGVTSAANSTTVPAGQVISQNPAAGTSVALGSAVNLVVSQGPPPPGVTLASITVSPTTPLILTAGTQAFTAVGTFGDGSTQNLTDQVTWESTSTGVATIASTGVATGVAQGTTTIRASQDGISGSTTLTVRTRLADFTPPTSTITSPASNSTITAPTDIIGTATDANFVAYKLEIAPAGETTFTLLASGTTASNGGVLGTIDPTALLNDLYTVRLTVFDQGGNATTSEVTVQVDTGMKVGNFSLTFTDLSVPLSGLPITVNRTYDSRDKRKGDFGIGWRLDVQTLRVRANRVQGTGWQVNKSGLNFVLVPADQHKISLTLPSGRVEEFDLLITPTSSFLLPLQAVTASYAPRPGTLGTLEVLDNPNLVILDSQPGEVFLL
ncbi:MAG: VCBS repeat-containing protein, partial [Deltaproteobacteria bacterium]|nr:VCBS repeat-containing protein [Deltaproteobacteria bacterium]